MAHCTAPFTITTYLLLAHNLSNRIVTHHAQWQELRNINLRKALSLKKFFFFLFLYITTMTTTTCLPHHNQAPQTGLVLATLSEGRIGPVSLAPCLPSTPYRDEHDSNGFTKREGYRSVQRSILAWLDRHTTDDLTAQLAYHWTQEVDPETCLPSPQEAVALCYYMRSLHFNTYVRFKKDKDEFACFIANPETIRRGTVNDKFYWKQDLKTGVIERPPRATRRRGAISFEAPTNLLAPSSPAATVYSGDTLPPSQPPPTPRLEDIMPAIERAQAMIMNTQQRVRNMGNQPLVTLLGGGESE
ncbi:hypothetical protein CC78DRAFT_215420 [Lojkania enalia]|uniref:Uncharacterized protein n=1 Tax=Lojkania enalia TaxID=147567 RepID=A0A9P4N6N2_9PLEO|nr:hypothetical protein CC78DRAFT_215420 [Didymosphaeria enalia]